LSFSPLLSLTPAPSPVILAVHTSSFPVSRALSYHKKLISSPLLFIEI
jgi:hypothetical protein